MVPIFCKYIVYTLNCLPHVDGDSDISLCKCNAALGPLFRNLGNTQQGHANTASGEVPSKVSTSMFTSGIFSVPLYHLLSLPLRATGWVLTVVYLLICTLVITLDRSMTVLCDPNILKISISVLLNISDKSPSRGHMDFASLGIYPHQVV